VTVFVDTSAFIAVLDADDKHHQKAKAKWEELISQEVILVCSNYILVETVALIQHRLGIEAVRTFQQDIVPILTVEWVDEAEHQGGIAGVLAAGRKKLSLVDCVSFNLMRRLGINSAFAFDRHFGEQGFRCIPQNGK
jgi:predicted nucleic acid-binding protein